MLRITDRLIEGSWSALGFFSRNISAITRGLSTVPFDRSFIPTKQSSTWVAVQSIPSSEVSDGVNSAQPAGFLKVISKLQGLGGMISEVNEGASFILAPDGS